MKSIRALISSPAAGLFFRLAQSYCAAASVLFLFSGDEPQIVSLLTFLLMFWALGTERKPDGRVRAVAGLLAVFFALASLLANYSYLVTYYALFSRYSVYMALVLWVFFYGVLRLLYGGLRACEPYDKGAGKRLSPGMLFLVSFVLFAALYTLVFLTHYPGVVMADQRTQLCQIVGLDPYSNHHPVAHTLLMKVFFDLGYALLGTQNAGVAFICVSQYLTVAAVFAYVVSTIRHFGLNRGWILASILFFGLAPHNLFFSVVMVKDIPFALMVLLLMTVLWRLVPVANGGEPVKKHVFEWCLLLVSSAGVCLMRTNGIYAFLPFLLLSLLFLRRRAYRLLLPMAAGLALALLFRGPVLTGLGVTPPDTIEALSLPAQHIARVIADGKELTGEETELLGRVVDLARVADTYDPHISDPIKDLVRATGDQGEIRRNRGAYFKLWLKLGIRYPKEYLYAEIDETVGFWYPNVSYESMYMGGIHPESTRLDISTEPKLAGEIPALLFAYLTGARIWPVFGLIFSIGFATWTAIAMLGLAIVNRRREGIWPYLLPLFVLGTLLIATPVHAEFRYLYSLYVSLPMLCLFPFVSFDRPAAERQKKS